MAKIFNFFLKNVGIDLNPVENKIGKYCINIYWPKAKRKIFSNKILKFKLVIFTKFPIYVIFTYIHLFLLFRECPN